MGSAITEVVPIAVGMVLANPFPVLAVILLLFSPRGTTTAAAFLIGWVAGLVIALSPCPWSRRAYSGTADPSICFHLRLRLDVLLLGPARSKGQRRRRETDAPPWFTRSRERRPLPP